MLKKIKNHPNNKKIKFYPEKHYYECEGKPFKGITSLIGRYTAPFEKMKIAKFIAYRDGISVQDVLKKWDEAREYGNFVDEVLDNWLNFKIDMSDGELDHIKKALKEKNLKPLMNEWVIFDRTLKRASAIDLVCIDESNDKKELVIVDLKSMEKPIKKESYKNKKMSYPINSLPDSKFYKQCLQVGFYKYWLENNYGLKVANNNYVLRVRPDFYEWVELEDVEQQIEQIYEFENE